MKPPETLTSTATCSALSGVVEATGETLGAHALAQRVGWLTALVQQFSADLIAQHWDSESLATLAAGADPAGRRLPAQGATGVGWRRPAGVVRA